MSQIFHRSTNTISRLTIYGAVFVVASLAWTGAAVQRSSYVTRQGEAREQVVPFSHQHHVAGLGLDCRYCHNTVEHAAVAALPPAATCMNCHATIQNDSPSLALVRESYATGVAIPWVRVHMLPDYAFFDHSVHLAAGVGCASCHGRIDTMEVVRQQEPLSMSWCLDCHRDPAQNLRPRLAVTDMSWDATRSSYDPHADPLRTRQPSPPQNCSGCHR